MTISIMLLILKVSGAIVFIFGPAFIWQYIDLLDTYIINNTSDAAFDKFIAISAPFFSVLLGLYILLRLLDPTNEERSFGQLEPTKQRNSTDHIASS